MAAQLLLLTLFSNIHAEVIKSAGWNHDFLLDDAADFCLVSRWTGDKKELLWNSSALFYQMSRLAVSDSGQYQVQCWTRGKVTVERISTLLVCDDQMTYQTLDLNVGETVELTCDGVGPNQTVQWAYSKSQPEGLILIDDETPSVYQLQLMENKPSLLLTVDRPSDYISYYCLEKQQLRCDLHSGFSIQVPPEYILRSVGESLKLKCSDGSRKQTHKWTMFNSLRSESLNSTLMLPSLTLDHSGSYTCDLGVSGGEHYYLFVCPELEPPVVQRFSRGAALTLRCRGWKLNYYIRWFMRSGRTGGRVFDVEYQKPDNMYLSDGSLVISDIPQQDSGQFWCVVKKGRYCVFRCEFWVKPEVDLHLLRSVLLSVVMLMMLCVVVVVVGVIMRRSRRSKQLPAPVEELEMSQLSPESHVQEEAPV